MAVLTVEKMVDILELICSSQDGRGTRSLARDLGLNVATVHNIARTLVSRGLLRQDATTKRFYPGIRLLILGRREDYLEQLSRISLPVVQQLATTLDESVMLGAIDHWQIIKLAYVPSNQALRVHDPDDMSSVAYCTAIGKVMLAAMPPTILDAYLQRTPLESFTPRTIHSPEALKDELQRVRKQELGATCDELCEGISAIAVPVMDPWGTTIAALGASAPSIRMSKTGQRERMIQSLRVAAKSLAEAWAGVKRKSHDAE